MKKVKKLWDYDQYNIKTWKYLDIVTSSDSHCGGYKGGLLNPFFAYERKDVVPFDKRDRFASEAEALSISRRLVNEV